MLPGGKFPSKLTLSVAYYNQVLSTLAKQVLIPSFMT